MKYYVKKGARIFYDYIMVLLVFMIFLYPLISITKDKFNSWLTIYSILLFVFLFFLVYTDMKELAVKEKKPQYELNPYPWKGLICGLIGIIPVMLITAVFSFVHFGDPNIDRIRHVGVNAFLGPLYFFIRWFGEALPAYFAAILLIPVISALGYLAGYYGIEIIKKVIKKKQPVQEKGFTKSPWNPTLNEKKRTKKKKKRNDAGGQ